jgi:hypothetical protein
MNGHTNINSQTTVYVIRELIAAVAEDEFSWFWNRKIISLFFRCRSDTLNQVDEQLRNLYQAYVKFWFFFFWKFELCSQTSNTSTNVSLNAFSNQNPAGTRKRMFQVRRTFLLIVAFDVIFMVLLWIIYNQVCSNFFHSSNINF